MVIFQSATGKNIKVYVKNEYFEVEVEGLGKLRNVSLKNGMICENYPRVIGGKKVFLKIKATPEAEKVYADWKKEISAIYKEDKKYRDGYNRIINAMQG